MTGRPAPRPKRGGEEFARNHYAESDDNQASKRVRFDTRNPAALAADAPEDDVVLDADEIGRRGAQTKRNAVNIDGYESDSSNEGFAARAEAKSKQARKGSRKEPGKSKDEEEDDMFADIEEKQFADGDEDEELLAEGKKRRDVKLIDTLDIDGQVTNSKSGGHLANDILANPEHARDKDYESESSEDDEAADALRAAVAEGMDEELGAGSKKQHAPRLEAFNLREENEDGGFDEQHNYVRKAKDPDAVYDNWLEGMSKKDMKKAKEAHEKRERERRAKDKEDDEVLTSEVLRTLIPHLERGETVMEALARLGRRKGGTTTKQPRWKTKKNRTDGMEVDVDGQSHNGVSEDQQEKKRRQAVESITDAADRLMSRGQEEIYEAEREMLTRLYKRETGEEWADINADTVDEDGSKQWEYRWSDARDGGDVHGPYDGDTMEAWNGAGYFGEGVEFRRSDMPGAAWSSSVDFK